MGRRGTGGASGVRMQALPAAGLLQQRRCSLGSAAVHYVPHARAGRTAAPRRSARMRMRAPPPHAGPPHLVVVLHVVRRQQHRLAVRADGRRQHRVDVHVGQQQSLADRGLVVHARAAVAMAAGSAGDGTGGERRTVRALAPRAAAARGGRCAMRRPRGRAGAAEPAHGPAAASQPPRPDSEPFCMHKGASAVPDGARAAPDRPRRQAHPILK
jgi:hypothetical protein